MEQRRPGPIPLASDEDQQVVAVGLLTEHDLGVLGQGFRRAYRLEREHDFHELLGAIDRAEQALRMKGPTSTG